MRFSLQVLKERQLYTKFRKCEFFFRSVAVLGHIISGDAIEVDPKKTDAVGNCPKPLTTTYIIVSWV